MFFTQKTGAKLTSRIWTEASVNLGNQLNVVTDNGRTIFNDTDVITSRYGIRLHTIITDKMNILLDYNYMEKESRFVPVEFGTDVPNPVSYQTQNITVTLLWTI
jgi:hypothetical protein